MAGFRVGGEESKSENTEAEEGFPAQTGKAQLFASDWRAVLIDDKSEKIKKVLGQLLKFTEQLARSVNDPTVDVRALARSCDRQLAVLKKLLPPGTDFRNGAVGGEDRRQLMGLLHAVNDRTENCIRLFRAAKTRVENEMGSMRRTRRAVKAYRPPARPPHSRFSGAIT